MALFVSILITSNIASSAKIIDWGFSIFGVSMVFSAGTLLFLISYIFGDVLTELYGFKRSRRVIWAGFGVLALSILFFSVIRALPWEIFTSLILTNYLFKVCIEALFTPVTYCVVNGLKKAKGEDFYDYGTHFTPV